MIRHGMRNTIESPSLEKGFRIDNLNRYISDNRTLPPKKGQAWNYAVFLENLYQPSELYPNNEIYNFQDVRRQYDFKTDVAYKLKESPYEALSKARQEYMDAVEASKDAPITLPFIDKIEELALIESLEQFNVPEQIREQFLNFENNLKTLQLPDEVKKSMRAIAYMDFLKSQEIQPVEIVDPTTGAVMFKSATMAGAVDKSASTGFPSVVKDSLRMTPKELMGADLARIMGIPFLTVSQARAMLGTREPLQPVKPTYGDIKDNKGAVTVVRGESSDDSASVASTPSASVATSASAPVSVIRDEPVTEPPQPKTETKRAGGDAWDIPKKTIDKDEDEDDDDDDEGNTPSTRPTQVKQTQRRNSIESSGWFGGIFRRGAGGTQTVETPKDKYTSALNVAINAVDQMREKRTDAYNKYVNIMPFGYGKVGKFSGGTPPSRLATAFKDISNNQSVEILEVRKAMADKYKRELKNITNFDAVHEIISTMISRGMFKDVKKNF